MTWCQRILLFSITLAQTAALGINITSIDLPLGDINVLVLTDVHSWVGGHGAHESPKIDADYGNVLSFYERLKYACREAKRDLWFVTNGDFVDGTGLTTVPPAALVPLEEKMPFDAVNVGNHELYESETISFITQPGGYVHWFGNRYLTSNVILKSTGEPMGKRYRFLKGSESTVLTFGFLYDMLDASPLVTVESVEEVVQSEWFISVLQGEQSRFDAILVLAHMDLKDPLVDQILDAIRNECGSNMPAQFITGHTHYRGYHKMDNYSTSFEAGRFLDTIGFVSFPRKRTASEDVNSTELFQHEFIEANVHTLRNKLGVERLATESGAALSKFVKHTREELGLTRVVGCAPRSFHLEAALDRNDSLWGLFVDKVIPTQFYRHNTSMILMQGKTSAFRYDFYAGNVTVDDIIGVSPFNDTIFRVAEDVSGSTLLALNLTLNQEEETMFLPLLPNYIVSGTISPHKKYDLFATEYEVPAISDALADIYAGPIQSKSLNVGTTSLLFSYIEESWSCSSHRPHILPGTGGFIQGDDTALQLGLYGFLSLAVIDITAVIVLIGVFVFRKLYVKPTPEVHENINRSYDTWESGTFA